MKIATNLPDLTFKKKKILRALNKCHVSCIRTIITNVSSAVAWNQRLRFSFMVDDFRSDGSIHLARDGWFVCPLLFVFSLGTSCNRSLLLLRAHAGGKRLFCYWIYQRKKIRFVSSGDKLLTRKWVVFPSAFEQQFFCRASAPRKSAPYWKPFFCTGNWE